MGWGMATVEYGKVRGPFYRAGGWEGRQCGERNGQRRSAPLMAFKPSVLGGERRGRRPVWKGKRRRSSSTRFCAEEATRGHRARRRIGLRSRGGGIVRNARRHPTCSQNMHTGFTPAAYNNPNRLDPTQT
jgi:hypothetical protein